MAEFLRATSSSAAAPLETLRIEVPQLSHPGGDYKARFIHGLWLESHTGFGQGASGLWVGKGKEKKESFTWGRLGGGGGVRRCLPYTEREVIF